MTTSSWDDYLAPGGDDPLATAPSPIASSSEQTPSGAHIRASSSASSSASGWSDWTAATGDGWVDTEGRTADAGQSAV